MTRDTARFSPEVGSLYSYVEVADWTVTPTHCTYRQWGGITSSYGWGFTGYCTLQWWENGTWHDAADEVSKYYSGYGDEEYDYIPSDSFVRGSADRIVSLGNYAHAYVNGTNTSARAWIDFTVPHLPDEPTGLTATYDAVNSPNQITLSWTSPTRSCDNLRIEVSIDGGSWSELPAISAGATSYAYTSVTDDHSYKFRMRAYYQKAYSSYTSETTAITTKPTAPTSISTAAISGGTDIAVTLENASSVATAIEWQYSTDNKATWSASTTVNGSPVTSFTATGITGTAYIRVANKNSTGTSAWLVSDAVTTICPPNPPTLTAPSGNVLDLADGNVTFAWLHNTLDGSAQSAAQLDYSTNGGSTWTSITSITTAQSYTMAIPWSAGTTVTWRVKTKGADASYSNWSSTKTFNVYTAPTLVISSPGATITGMPISVAATYSDMAGFTCQAATLTLPNGQTKSCNINGTAITASIGIDEWLPTNGESYTIVLTVRSSSSLQTITNATFAVAFVEPVAGELNISNDYETGCVSLLATFENSEYEEQYSGNTNTQYDSEPGYIKSLTVKGQSEVQDGNVVCIEHVTVGQLSITASLREAGTAQDELQATDTEYTVNRKVGYVDLGDLTWLFSSGYSSQSTSTFYAKDLESLIKIPAQTAAANVLSILPTKSRNDFAANTYDCIAVPSSGHLYIRDSAFAGITNPAVFQASMRGTLLFYELKTPTTDATASYSTMPISSTFNIETELDSTFTMTWGSPPAAQSISVARVNQDGTITTIIEDGASGSGAVDKYAPLNKPYKYVITTKSAIHSVKTVYVDNIIETDLWFAYWTVKDGENVVEKMASAKWNPDNGGIQITRPQKTRVFYAGRKDPVSYDGSAVSLTETPSWMLVERDEIEPFVELIEDGGRGVYKSCDGWVYHADFDLMLTPKYIAIGYYGGIGLTVTRIAGDLL